MKTLVDDTDGEANCGFAQALPAGHDGAATTSPSSPSSPSPGARSAHAALAAGLASFRAARAAWLVLPDAETLHDARVALRKLRMALTVYEVLVRLPSGVTQALPRRLSRRLAPLRDVDVAIYQVQQLSGTPGEPEVRDRLERERERARRAVVAAFHHRGARRWQRALQRWLRDSAFQEAPMADGQKALSTRVGQLWPLLDSLSGWAIDAPDLATAAVEALDDLHRLRRRLRDARYLLELGIAAGLCEPHLPIVQLQQLQDGLGGLQDLRVLRDTLGREVGSEWAKLAPRLAQALEAVWSERWLRWVELKTARWLPQILRPNQG